MGQGAAEAFSGMRDLKSMVEEPKPIALPQGTLLAPGMVEIDWTKDLNGALRQWFILR